jgi:hypothetical protein
LNGDLEEEVYVEAPEGSGVSKRKVWKLKKAIYGLKQAPRVWYTTLAAVMKRLGFKQSSADPCLFPHTRFLR